VKPQDRRAQARRKARIEERLDPSWQKETKSPMLRGVGTRYAIAERVRAVACGGIGLMHRFVLSLGLVEAINERLRLFKRHFPYHESDHVLNLAYNLLAGGTCLQDLELLRTNESYLDLLGCRRIPDPTTAGDFLRRFAVEDVEGLQGALYAPRKRVWQALSKSERRLACVDVDGTLSPTTGACKDGMDISYKGTWGYAPLVVTLANTGEVLETCNRPGNAPSHQGAPFYLDRAIQQLREGGFRRVRLRGDTDFSLTRHFDKWSDKGVEFVFGMDAHRSFVARAAALPEGAWERLRRRQKRQRRTSPRRRLENVKERIVAERGYRNLMLEQEDVAELAYQPTRSKGRYRLVVLRKTIRVVEGQQRLYDEVRYLFYVTNVPQARLSTAEVVFEANARCHQENLIEQLKNGVHALRMPSDGLVSNWAYLVIASLAWNLKAWLAVCLRHLPGAGELGRMEYRRFLNSLMLVPCQVVKGARGLLLRLLVYSPWAEILLEGMEHFRRRRLA